MLNKFYTEGGDRPEDVAIDRQIAREEFNFDTKRFEDEDE